jgi:ubiquinone/menaquinone biosynthesis C-methylase UbiE
VHSEKRKEEAAIMMTELEQYYNKFNEEKRLDSRHGKVEFITSMKYIHEYLGGDTTKKILDIGAGTGKYSVALAEEGYDVSAVELVKHNLGLLKAKNSSVKAYQGNALKLRRFENDTFDVTLLFGPMYHLFTKEDKVRALCEAKRVTKPGGDKREGGNGVARRKAVRRQLGADDGDLCCIEYRRWTWQQHSHLETPTDGAGQQRTEEQGPEDTRVAQTERQHQRQLHPRITQRGQRLPDNRRQETGKRLPGQETTLPVVAKPDAEHGQSQQQAGDQ